MEVIVENLESLSDWVMLEYRNISGIVGKARLTFTNCLEKGLEGLGKIEAKSVNQLRPAGFIVLDPSAKRELKPEDFEKFRGIIVGGICGDVPPQARTSELITFPAERRNIGSGQFTTDNAVLVAKLISLGTRLSEIGFVDGIEIWLNEIESVRLEFRYPVIDGKPMITPGLKELLMGKERF